VQPIAELGRRAVKLILANAPGTQRELLGVELAVRGSTAPPAVVARRRRRAAE